MAKQRNNGARACAGVVIYALALGCVAAQESAPPWVEAEAPEEPPATDLEPEEAAPEPIATSRARELLELARAAEGAHRPGDARAAVEEAIAAVMADESAADGEFEPLLAELGAIAHRSGALAAAKRARTALVERRRARLAPDDRELLAAEHELATTYFALRDLQAAKALFAKVLEARRRSLPDDHVEVLSSKSGVAACLAVLGERAQARDLYEEILAAKERALPPEHPEVLSAKQNLATILYTLRDLEGARARMEDLLSTYARLGRADDDEDLLIVEQNLASVLAELGDCERARDLLEKLVRARERTLPPEHPAVVMAKQNLAVTLGSLGEHARARARLEEVLAARKRALGDDHIDVLMTKSSLAETERKLGHLAEARRLASESLAALERRLPPDDPQILRVKRNLGAVLFSSRELGEARALFDEVLAARERALPADHPDVLDAKENLGATLTQLGDLPAARAMLEEVVRHRTAQCPADHPDLSSAQMFLGIAHFHLGSFAEARMLFEAVVAARRRPTGPPSADLLSAEHALSVTLLRLGEVDAAAELAERVLDERERLLPADHPQIAFARQLTAAVLRSRGDLAGERALDEQVLAAAIATRTEDHPDVLAARRNLALALAHLGEGDGARAQLDALIEGLKRRVGASLSLAPREARERAASDAHWIEDAVGLCELLGTADEHARDLFELRETERAASTAGAARGVDPAELEDLRRSVAHSHAALSERVSSGPRDGEDAAAWREALQALARERDATEARVSEAIAAHGGFAGPVTVGDVARVLDAHEVAVGYRRDRRASFGTRLDSSGAEVEHFLAHVVAPDGRLAIVELGSAAAIEDAITAWRAALGKPADGSGAAPSRASEELAAGDRLRRLILDPVIAASNVGANARTLHVAPDDVLFLVPLDALPSEPGRVGDRWEVETAISFRPAPVLRRLAERAAGLVAVGDIDYDLEPPAPPVAAVEASDARHSGPLAFRALPESAVEIDAVARSFEAAFGGQPVTLRGAAATTAAFRELAPRARFLHVTTHGWFAPEMARSWADAPRTGAAWQPMTLEETVIGFAPMTLCGLALAGANRGRDSGPMTRGILTAEELAGFDLSNCELAVLSACETRVGIRRAGQGIQSLQSALHAAGARTSLTSLWKVDDAASRRLMELFYRGMWSEQKPPQRALWDAKRTMRAERSPARDWAGWVLTGSGS